MIAGDCKLVVQACLKMVGDAPYGSKVKGVIQQSTQIRIPKVVQVLWTQLLSSISRCEIVSNPAIHTRKVEVFVMRITTPHMSN